MLKIKKLFNQWYNLTDNSAEQKLVELLDKYTVTNPYFVYDATNKRRIFLFVKDGIHGKYFNFATVYENDKLVNRDCWEVIESHPLLDGLKFLDDKAWDYFIFCYHRKKVLDEIFYLDSIRQISITESLKKMQENLNEMKLRI